MATFAPKKYITSDRQTGSKWNKRRIPHQAEKKRCEYCSFYNNNKEIKSQIIQCCSSTRLRRKPLREELSLDDLIKAARALEISEIQPSQIEKRFWWDKCSHQKKIQAAELTTTIGKKEKCKVQKLWKGISPQKSKCSAEGNSCNYCHKKNINLFVDQRKSI